MNITEVKKITVLGMGTMGPDIALAFSIAGYEVTGVDIEQPILARARQRITTNCRQIMEEDQLEKTGDLQSRIHLTLDWDRAVADADYITEAVPENMEIKRRVLKRCEEVCRKEVVLASNTSTMSITELTSGMRYPRRCIGTHWIIPAHLSPSVEIVPGRRTSQGTTKFVFGLLRKVGKRPAVCKDNPGFIHNSVQVAMIQGALALVERGVATPEDVDTMIENGFALRLPAAGPIRIVDLIGLDAFLGGLRYLYVTTGNPIYKPSKLLEDKVQKGDLGLKTKRGFYDYTEDEVSKLRREIDRTIIKTKSLKERQP